MNNLPWINSSKRKTNTKSNAFCFLSILAILFVLFNYLWCLKTRVLAFDNNYYSQLAVAFKDGQLSLKGIPDPALLALKNPYNYQSRIGIAFPWDTSLYDGRFYLYWGPMPALLLTIFNVNLLSKIGDQHLTFIFTSGMFLYTVAFLYAIWRRFFQKLPAWMFIIAIITMGLAIPFTWILSTPRIYEASISSGQFFFMGGCYWAYMAIANRTLRTFKLTTAGIHWACAIGSRITLAPAIAFILIMVLIKAVREDWPLTASRKTAFTVLAPILPVAICGIGLAWYNWARFGSIFEFGLRYQLTNVDYSNFTNSFSTGYITENLYNYLTHAFATASRFPYVKPIENIASNERMVGLLIVVPYSLLAVIPIALFINHKSSKITADPKNDDKPELLNWLIITLTGATCISFILLLVFYFAAMRYLMDIAPSLLLLSTIGFWGGYQAIRSAIVRVSFAALSGLLVTGSIISSTLFTIALSGNRLLIILRIIKYIHLPLK